MGRGLQERYEETFRGDENIVYLDCGGGGYTTAYVCQNSSHCISKRANFITCTFMKQKGTGKGGKGMHLFAF